MTKTIDDVLKLAKVNVQFIDYKFVDFPGVWQHVSVPVHEFNKDIFTEGKGFGRSSIRGWCEINNSDMLMVPDPSTAFMDPFCHHPTMSLTCNIFGCRFKIQVQPGSANIAQKQHRT